MTPARMEPVKKVRKKEKKEKKTHEIKTRETSSQFQSKSAGISEPKRRRLLDLIPHTEQIVIDMLMRPSKNIELAIKSEQQLVQLTVVRLNEYCEVPILDLSGTTSFADIIVSSSSK